MRTSRWKRRLITSIAAAMAAVLVAAGSATPAAAAPAFKVLVFSKTAGFRHSSIPNGIAAVQALGTANNFAVDATEDAAAFTTANLAQYKAVVWMSTTGDVLNDTQQAAFESYIRAGGGYVGVHAAADTEYTWGWYGNLVGAWFASTRRSSRRRSRSRPGQPGDRAPAADLDPHRRVVQLPDQSPQHRQGADEPRRGFIFGRQHGRRPPDLVVQAVRRRPLLVHRARSHRGVLHRGNFTGHLLGGIQWAAGQKQADCRPETGYQALFDGSQTSLDRWRQAGPGGFTLADGTLTSFGGMGLLWYPVSQFSNSSLKLDWQMPGDDNGGVFIGFPDPNGDPWGPVNAGHEIQIDATDADPSRTTGSVYSLKAPDAALRAAALNPPGQWNTYEVGVHGQRVEIWLNGLKINDYTSTRAIASGYIGVQNDGAGADILYRNIRIKSDGAPPATDIALGKTATASSVEPNSTYVATNAVDGNAGTRWGSVHADPQWWQVDLGRLVQPQPGPDQLGSRVREVVPDPDLSQRHGLDERLHHDHRRRRRRRPGPHGTGRYVRVNQTQRGHHVGLLDLGRQRVRHPGGHRHPVAVPELPGDGVVGRDRQPARRRQRRRRQRHDPLGQRLHRPAVDPARPRATRSITRVKLTWEAAYGKAYQIQTSADGNTWTNVYTTTTGDGGVDDVTVTGTGRYLRVNGTQRATQWGYSLWELEAFGS